MCEISNQSWESDKSNDSHKISVLQLLQEISKVKQFFFRQTTMSNTHSFCGNISWSTHTRKTLLLLLELSEPLEPQLSFDMQNFSIAWIVKKLDAKRTRPDFFAHRDLLIIINFCTLISYVTTILVIYNKLYVMKMKCLSETSNNF